MTVQIAYQEIDFVFSASDEACWFDLDYEEAEAEGYTMRINADREVYAIITDPAGEKHYGTIGDEENEVLADNFPIYEDESYIFYENPDTEKYYV